MIVYSQPNCPMCAYLKQELDLKKIPYEVCTDGKIMDEKGIESVPVIEYLGTMMNMQQALAWLNAQPEPNFDEPCDECTIQK